MFCKFSLYSVDNQRLPKIKKIKKIVKKASKKTFILKQPTVIWNDFYLQCFLFFCWTNILLQKFEIRIRPFILKQSKKDDNIQSIKCIRQLSLLKLFTVILLLWKPILPKNQSASKLTKQPTAMPLVSWMWLQAFVGSHFLVVL